MDWKDIAVRAFKTAVQVAIATVPVSAYFDKDWTLVATGVLAGVAAGISVVQNAVKQYRDSKKVVTGERFAMEGLED